MKKTDSNLLDWCVKGKKTICFECVSFIRIELAYWGRIENTLGVELLCKAKIPAKSSFFSKNNFYNLLIT